MIPEQIPFTSIKTPALKLKCDKLDVLQLTLIRKIPVFCHVNTLLFTKVPKATNRVDFAQPKTDEKGNTLYQVYPSQQIVSISEVTVENKYRQIRTTDLEKFFHQDPVYILCFESSCPDYDLAFIHHLTPYMGFGVEIDSEHLYIKSSDLHNLLKPLEKLNPVERAKMVREFAEKIYDGKMNAMSIATRFHGEIRPDIPILTIKRDINYMDELKRNFSKKGGG